MKTSVDILFNEMGLMRMHNSRASYAMTRL